MSGIKGKNTAPEMRVRKALHRAGFRFRLHDAKLPGKPDIILPKYKAAIFVHGCFWHRHEGCRNATLPKTNPEFWEEKFTRNLERDAENIAKLHRGGWRVGVIWECAVRQQGEQAVIVELAAWLASRCECPNAAFVISGRSQRLHATK